MATTGSEPLLDRPAPENRSEVAATAPPTDRRWLVEIALPLALFLMLAVLAFSPHNPFNATALPKGASGDPVQMTWFLAYTPWALLHGHNPLLTNYLDYPSGVNLGANTSVPLLGVLAAPITLTLGPIAAFNVLLRLALAVSAGALYLVLRRWCRSRIAAFVGGLAYGFGPYLMTHLQAEGHLNLIFVPVPALALLVFDAAFVRQRGRAGLVGLAAGLLATAQLLISPEVLSEVGIVGLIALVGLSVCFPHEARRRARFGLRVFGVAALVFVVTAALPLAEALFGAGHLHGAVASVNHLQSFRADLVEFFLPTSNALVAPAGAVRAAATALAPLRKAGGSAEIGGYLGIPLVVVLVLCVVRFRRDRLVVTLAALAVVAAVLSLGSRLDVDGHVTAVRLPEAVLAHLPLLDDTVPARFGLLVALFTAALLAIGLDRSLGALGAAGRRGWAAGYGGLVLLGGVVLLALAPQVPIVHETPATSTAVTAELERAVTPGSVVLAYPYPDPPYDVAMLWAADTNLRFKLLGGYATINGPHNRAQLFGPLLEPALLQEALAVDEDAQGKPRHYPAPQPAGNLPAALCRYLVANHVDAVVYTPGGAGGAAVGALLAHVLGPPDGHGAGLEIWRRDGVHPCHVAP